MIFKPGEIICGKFLFSVLGVKSAQNLAKYMGGYVCYAANQ